MSSVDYTNVKVAKVEHVLMLHSGNPLPGTLHITPHHLIFRRNPQSEHDDGLPRTAPEIWITYPIIYTVERRSIGYSNSTRDIKDLENGSNGSNGNGTTSLSREHSNFSEDSINSTTEAQKRMQALAIRLRCRDFTFLTFCFDSEQEARGVFDSIKKLTCCATVDRLYAFLYKPSKLEAAYNGWELYNPEREFERQGLTSDWRLSNINSNYSFCDTYPSKLWVPTTISDNTLNYVAKFRSRQRVPVLTYIHSINNCTLTRCAQPLSGLGKNRSIQDEKLVHAIFKSSNASGYASLGVSDPEATSSSASLVNVEQGGKVIYGAQQTNLIIDARPSVNAYAQHATGAGSEVMENYKFAKKEYLGIDNIHVMRDSLSKILEAIKDSDIAPLPANRDMLAKSNWLKHITGLLEGTNIIVRQVALEHSHVLIHCSDGWDRTAQLAALSQICLDPYFRTIEGFMVLVEKEWVSFGHKFRDRCGYLSSEKWFTQPADRESGSPSGGSGFEQALGAAKMFFNQQASNFRGGDDEDDPEGLDNPNPRSSWKSKKNTGINVKETSPVFQQFLDATYQLIYQYPTRFEFNERFLRRMLYHMYSCQYGTFLHNNEKERADSRIRMRTRSVWDYFLPRKQEFMNPKYDTSRDTDERGSDGRVIFPTGGTYKVRWWPEIFGRTDEEMNGRPSIFTRSGDASPMRSASRQGPIVVAEDSKGQLTAEVDAASPENDSNVDLSKSAAVLGTERAANLAKEEEAKSDLEASTADSITQDKLDVASNCATVSSSTVLDLSEIDESDSRISTPPVISLDATPENKSVDDEELVTIDPNSDPLGGHEAIDVALSPRAQGKGIGGIGSRFSRTRARSNESTPVEKELEVLQISPKA